MAAQGSDLFNTLTQSHGVKVLTGATAEECVLAAGKIVSCENIMSAERANVPVDNGLVIGGALNNVHPLTPVSRKVIMSNVFPFIEDEMLVRKLTRFGRVVAPIKKLAIVCQSEQLKHVLSFKRLTYMVLNNNATELQRKLTFKIDGFKYVIRVSTRFSPEDIEMLKVNGVSDIPELSPGLGRSASPL